MLGTVVISELTLPDAEDDEASTRAETDSSLNAESKVIFLPGEIDGYLDTELENEDEVRDVVLAAFYKVCDAYESAIIVQWIEVLLGTQSLAAASLFTNIAISLVRQAEQENLWLEDGDGDDIKSDNIGLLGSLNLKKLARADCGQLLHPLHRMQELIASVANASADESERLVDTTNSDPPELYFELPTDK